MESEDIHALARVAAGCDLCRLADTRTNVVFGAGRVPSDVMFVADAPGYRDDQSGDAFSGPAGELLDELLDEIGLRRADTYVTHVVKCRPPRNRSPFPDEIETCEGYLFRQVAAVRPRVVCAFGNIPLRLLTGRPLHVADIHGEPIVQQIGGRETIVYPLYHPGAVAHSAELQATLRGEFRAIPQLAGMQVATPRSPLRDMREAISELTAVESDGQLGLDVGDMR